jgi:large conductance mechanosensitive channel
MNRAMPGDVTGPALEQLGLSRMTNPQLLFSPGGRPMFKEFKEFAMRGNVLDMAVGIIIGAAFGRIVSSFVEDILMPPIGMLLGRVDFGNLFVTLSGTAHETLSAAKEAGAVTVNYGVFFNHVFNFLIVAFAVFLLIRQVNRLRRQQESAPAAPTTKDCPYCKLAVPLAATKCGHCTSQLQPA